MTEAVQTHGHFIWEIVQSHAAGGIDKEISNKTLQGYRSQLPWMRLRRAQSGERRRAAL